MWLYLVHQAHPARGAPQVLPRLQEPNVGQAGVSRVRSTVLTERVDYAFGYMDVLKAAQTADGSCRYCTQPLITARHNCNTLRELAFPLREAKRSARVNCAHTNTRHVLERYIGSLALVCRDCGADLA